MNPGVLQLKLEKVTSRMDECWRRAAIVAAELAAELAIIREAGLTAKASAATASAEAARLLQGVENDVVTSAKDGQLEEDSDESPPASPVMSPPLESAMWMIDLKDPPTSDDPHDSAVAGAEASLEKLQLALRTEAEGLSGALELVKRKTAERAAEANQAYEHRARAMELRNENRSALLQLLWSIDHSVVLGQLSLVDLHRTRGASRGLRRHSTAMLLQLPRPLVVGGSVDASEASGPHDSSRLSAAVSNVSALNLATLKWEACRVPDLPMPLVNLTLSCSAAAAVEPGSHHRRSGAPRRVGAEQNVGAGQQQPRLIVVGCDAQKSMLAPVVALQWQPGETAWSDLPSLPLSRGQIHGPW